MNLGLAVFGVGAGTAEEGTMQTRGLKLSAVLVGLMVDIGGTTIGGTLLGALLAIPLASAGAGAGEVEAAVVAAILTPKWLAVGSLLGLSCTALGGYVAARMGRHEPMKHALALGIASLVTGVLIQFGNEAGVHATPLWFDALGYVLVVPAALLGGCLVERRSGEVLGATPPTPTPIG